MPSAVLESELLVGNTYFYTVYFYDEDGVTPLNVDTDSVKFTTYTDSLEVVKSESIPESAKLSEGKYKFSFTPNEVGAFILEFSAKVTALPILDRKRVIVRKYTSKH